MLFPNFKFEKALPTIVLITIAKKTKIATMQYIINEFEVNEAYKFSLNILIKEITIPCVKNTPKLFVAIISKNLNL